ncbi:MULTISPECIES: N-6 DNA methylase [Acinetobacter]|uniref:N-6 DNA methylase n=1 Tax=Acinetobacter TaxID=469 RepID=UPI001CE40ED1|nr:MULTISPECIES: N-6 DNA methylase [Acinetobacter]MCH7319443.1 SAM-dependent methyltransferase [Acinetobacter higginsii]
MNKKIALGQFYTPPSISLSMVTIALKLLGFHPSNAIELAAGYGDLIHPLKIKVPSCNITAVDIDSKNAMHLKNNMHYQVYNKDSMSALDFLDGTKFDLALGNPPFLSNINVNDTIKKILKDYLNLNYKIGSGVRAELVFISQYISLLVDNGILAIIFPDSLISGINNTSFRKSLLEMWEIEKIIEIKGAPFEFTEAKTHIVYVRKCKPNSKKIRMFSMDQNGKCSKGIKIQRDMLIDRMDYSYFKNNCYNSGRNRVLGDFASIKRGRKTHKALIVEGGEYLHSTHVNKYKEFSPILESQLYLCRVGARIVGKSFLYCGTPLEFTDCLYHIDFYDSEVKKDFYSYINTEEGFNKLKSIARGVCSKYLTVKDLKEFKF